MTQPTVFPAAASPTGMVHLQAEDGSQAIVSLLGGQVVSWHAADGRERLYLSPRALWDGSASIRGGIPVCWPQFNRRGPLAKHGFARMCRWRVAAQGTGTARLVLTQEDVTAHWLCDDAGEVVWNHPFRLELDVVLQPGALSVTLSVHNTGSASWAFTTALHSYLAVQDLAALRLQGADGVRYWDAVAGADPAHPVQQGDIVFGQEVDRVYPAPAAWRLQEPAAVFDIHQSPSMTESVVWNPGPVLGAALADLPPHGYAQFVCVEAAHIDGEITVPPGGCWQGGQVLSVALPGKA